METLKNIKEENEKKKNKTIGWEALKNIKGENDLSALPTSHSAIIHKNQIMVGDDISQIELSENSAKQKNHIWNKCFNMIMMPIKYILNPFFQAFIWIYRPKDEREFSFRYSVLVKDLKKHKTIAKFYFFIELIRFLLLSLIVSQFYANPLAQVCLLEVVCLFFLIFLIAIKPFEMKIEMYLCFFNEFMVNLAFISGVCLAWLDKEGILDSGLRMNFGWTIVYIYLILMYGLILNTFTKMMRVVINLVKKLLEKYRANKAKQI